MGYTYMGYTIWERGKCLLANNFIFVLNNFLSMHSHHPLIIFKEICFKNTDFLKK